jgi:cyclic pyranopterin phosphate synthase
MIDTFGRKINYLRLSVTDRCNLRCRYCLPAEGVQKLPREEILRYDELFRIVEGAVGLGVEKVRITGGEPLVRYGLTGFISRLSEIKGLKQLVLTTNGILLREMAEGLKAAGVQRLNISLDSLRPEVFAAISRGGDLSRVLAGIEAAEKSGFPIKINMVVMRGVNDSEIVDFADLALRKPYTVRFIEYMPAIKEINWQALVVPVREILSRIGNKFNYSPVTSDDFAGPAKEYRLEGGAGTIGVISPLSGHFCGSCNRIRVTATGMARGCLFSDQETDLRPFIRSFNAQALQNALRLIVSCKPDMHRLTEYRADHSAFNMIRIGG